MPAADKLVIACSLGLTQPAYRQAGSNKGRLLFRRPTKTKII
jgi:hypothetical protein